MPNQQRRNWMDWAMAGCLIPLFGFEMYAVENKVPGDTISERTRYYFQVKGKTGSMIFLGTLGYFCMWFAAHIVGNGGRKV